MLICDKHQVPHTEFVRASSIAAGDVGSTMTADLGTENNFALTADAAANLARAAASREKHDASTRCNLTPDKGTRKACGFISKAQVPAHQLFGMQESQDIILYLQMQCQAKQTVKRGKWLCFFGDFMTPCTFVMLAVLCMLL